MDTGSFSSIVESRFDGGSRFIAVRDEAAEEDTDAEDGEFIANRDVETAGGFTDDGGSLIV